MEQSISTPKFDWRMFLEQWSETALNTLNDSPSLFPVEVYESRWLGYPGATEEQIRNVEHRLEITLPSSYREFLKITNGWRKTTPFINRIWSVEQIEWFSVRHQRWIDSFLIEYSRRHHIRYSDNGFSPHVEIPDHEYFVYGDRQDCSKLRVEYLTTMLEISEKGESSIYLLNPQVVTEDGEWEAWFFGDWLPGADRYRSFQLMMQAEYKNFIEMHANEISN